MKQPPPLPGTGQIQTPPSRRHGFLGVAAFALGVICAGVTAAAIYYWRDIGRYRASLTPHATDGAVGFSLHFYPWLLTLCSVVIGIVAVAFLISSFVSRYSTGQRQFTFFQVGAALSLVPLLFLILRFVGIFLH